MQFEAPVQKTGNSLARVSRPRRRPLCKRSNCLDGFRAVLSVDAKILVEREDGREGREFRHPNKAGISERHRHTLSSRTRDAKTLHMHRIRRQIGRAGGIVIKSTKKHRGEDFRGYFFGLTAAEVLVAQSLKDQFRFIFVNTVTGSFLELKLNEVFSKARGIYPTWSISF